MREIAPPALALCRRTWWCARCPRPRGARSPNCSRDARAPRRTRSRSSCTRSPWRSSGTRDAARSSQLLSCVDSTCSAVHCTRAPRSLLHSCCAIDLKIKHILQSHLNVHNSLLLRCVCSFKYEDLFPGNSGDRTTRSHPVISGMSQTRGICYVPVLIYSVCVNKNNLQRCIEWESHILLFPIASKT